MTEQIVKLERAIGANRMKNESANVVYKYWKIISQLSATAKSTIDIQQLLIDIHCDLIAIDSDSISGDDYSFD